MRISGSCRRSCCLSRHRRSGSGYRRHRYTGSRYACSLYALNDRNKYLADNAAAVLVFPSITKAGAGVGGEHGDGALLQGGKTVGYYSVSGASIGVTLGVSRHSEVILFQTPQARDKFLNSKDWSIGADTSVAVAKMGAGDRYDTQTLSKPVLAFVFGEKGLMGDASLQGAKISKIAK